YDYKERLIDCETGFSIVNREHLLDEGGKIIASRDNTAANLSLWKGDLQNELQDHKWPSGSEIFLACAAAGNERFLAQRQLERKKKTKEIVYSPVIKALKADTNDIFWRKIQFNLELEPLMKHPPSNALLMFGQLEEQYRTWLSNFAPEMAVAVHARNDAPAAELSEENLQWLLDHNVDIAKVSSRPDGTVRYTNRQPNLFELPPEYQEAPQKLHDVENSELEIYLDCHSGLQIPTRLTWFGAEHRQLATNAIGVKPLLEMLRERMSYRDENAATNVLLPPSIGGSAQWICQAVAAQCNATPVVELEPFHLATDDEEAIQKVESQEETLLAIRNAYRNYRRSFIPNCALGKPF
ncbi:MAG: hypothetical protein PHU29_02825, partial [Sulfuricurvum sp.]|nr:hypothetical protein [Sulfuricurvum sp.]